MTTTHDYDMVQVQAFELTDGMVLVGESGGLSAVYGVSLLHGTVQAIIETEHGFLATNRNIEFDVLDLEDY